VKIIGNSTASAFSDTFIRANRGSFFVEKNLKLLQVLAVIGAFTISAWLPGEK